MSKVQETNFFPNFWHNLWKLSLAFFFLHFFFFYHFSFLHFFTFFIDWKLLDNEQTQNNEWWETNLKKKKIKMNQKRKKYYHLQVILSIFITVMVSLVFHQYIFFFNCTFELLIYNETLVIDYILPNLSSFSYWAIFFQSQFQVLKTSS